MLRQTTFSENLARFYTAKDITTDRPPQTVSHHDERLKMQPIIKKEFEESLLTYGDKNDMPCDKNMFMCFFLEELNDILKDFAKDYMLCIKGGQIYNSRYNLIKKSISTEHIELNKTLEILFNITDYHKIHNTDEDSLKYTITNKTDFDVELLIFSGIGRMRDFDFNLNLINLFIYLIHRINHGNLELLKSKFKILMKTLMDTDSIKELKIKDFKYAYDFGDGTLYQISKSAPVSEKGNNVLGLNGMAKMDDFVYLKIFSVVFSYFITKETLDAQKENYTPYDQRPFKSSAAFIDISVIDEKHEYNKEFLKKINTHRDSLYEEYNEFKQTRTNPNREIKIYINSNYNALFDLLYTLIFQYKTAINFLPWDNIKYVKKIHRIIFTVVIAIDKIKMHQWYLNMKIKLSNILQLTKDNIDTSRYLQSDYNDQITPNPMVDHVLKSAATYPIPLNILFDKKARLLFDLLKETKYAYKDNNSFFTLLNIFFNYIYFLKYYYITMGADAEIITKINGLLIYIQRIFDKIYTTTDDVYQ